MAIIGNGDIASALKEAAVDNGHITYFASGVSNSAETDQKQFDREMAMILDQDSMKPFVYFSTLSIYYSDTPYTVHKRRMESLVKTHFIFPIIIRIGNITWGANPNTLINYFKNKISKDELFNVQPVYRYLLSKDEFIHWMRLMRQDRPDIMNIPGTVTFVPDLVQNLLNEHRNHK